jgi:hypothetical protein
VVVSRLRTGYTRATHRHVIEKTPSPECSFCGVSLTTEHILWKCTETTREREKRKREREREREDEERERENVEMKCKN